ncbi:MAG: hypothetical protein K0B02_02310 [DPANN group archaeon]|nr:hypothetical protein [DPANN group archaeon]
MKNEPYYYSAIDLATELSIEHKIGNLSVSFLNAVDGDPLSLFYPSFVSDEPKSVRISFDVSLEVLHIKSDFNSKQYRGLCYTDSASKHISFEVTPKGLSDIENLKGVRNIVEKFKKLYK